MVISRNYVQVRPVIKIVVPTFVTQTKIFKCKMLINQVFYDLTKKPKIKT